jgi:hypothetical protein
MLLVILMEECNEVAHRISKALRFGLEEIQTPGLSEKGLTNADRIRREMTDLKAVFEMLEADGAFGRARKHRTIGIKYKKEKVEEYLKYSEKLGRLDPPKKVDTTIHGTEMGAWAAPASGTLPSTDKRI